MAYQQIQTPVTVEVGGDHAHVRRAAADHVLLGEQADDEPGVGRGVETSFRLAAEDADLVAVAGDHVRASVAVDVADVDAGEVVELLDVVCRKPY